METFTVVLCMGKTGTAYYIGYISVKDNKPLKHI